MLSFSISLMALTRVNLHPTYFTLTEQQLSVVDVLSLLEIPLGTGCAVGFSTAALAWSCFLVLQLPFLLLLQLLLTLIPVQYVLPSSLLQPFLSPLCKDVCCCWIPSAKNVLNQQWHSLVFFISFNGFVHIWSLTSPTSNNGSSSSMYRWFVVE